MAQLVRIVRSVVLCGVVAGALEASADTLGSARDEPLTEVRHAVVLERRGNEARLQTTRTIRNGGDGPTEVALEVSLPPGAVVTGFRHQLDGVWGRGRLLEAAAGFEAFWRRGSVAAQKRRGPALMAWSGLGAASIDIYPLAARATTTVRYAMRAPLCYAGGRYFAGYPRATEEEGLAPVVATVRGGKLVAAAELERDLGAEPFEDCGLSLQDGLLLVEFEGALGLGVRARYGRHALAGTKAIAALEFYIGEKLEAAPRGATVIFVLDGSHSVGAAGLAKELELSRRLLSSFPEARAEFVIYRRHAERLFGRPIAAAAVAEKLARVPASRLRAGNGSHLDRGLAMAAEIARGVTSPVRIYAMTDNEWRQDFGADEARAALSGLPATAVVHLLELGLDGGELSWDRDDDHELGEVVERWGGMAVMVAGVLGAMTDAESIIEGLVRPMMLEDLALEGASFAELEVPDTLEEGQGLRAFALDDGFAATAVLSGRIWGRRVRYELAPDAELSAALPALIFGQLDVDSQLGEAAALALATVGGVLSAQTSFLSALGGSPPGDLDDGIGLSGSATCGCSGGVTCSAVGVLGTPGVVGRAVFDPLDRRAILEQLLRPHVSACALSHQAGPFEVALTLELTDEEIVEVHLEDEQPSAVIGCIVEAAWQLELDGRFARGHQSYRLRYPWGTGVGASSERR